MSIIFAIHLWAHLFLSINRIFVSFSLGCCHRAQIAQIQIDCVRCQLDVNKMVCHDERTKLRCRLGFGNGENMSRAQSAREKSWRRRSAPIRKRCTVGWCNVHHQKSTNFVSRSQRIRALLFGIEHVFYIPGQFHQEAWQCQPINNVTVQSGCRCHRLSKRLDFDCQLRG